MAKPPGRVTPHENSNILVKMLMIIAIALVVIVIIGMLSGVLAPKSTAQSPDPQDVATFYDGCMGRSVRDLVVDKNSRQDTILNVAKTDWAALSNDCHDIAIMSAVEKERETKHGTN